MAEKGFIFDIQHFSTHDGPGIRSTVFLKGCPLHCSWCHNPESQAFHQEVLFYKTRCIGCGRCRGQHHKNPEMCMTGAMEPCGNFVTTTEVLHEVMKDAAYYRHSGGGITISGGEPAAQAAFTAELLEISHQNNLHTTIETSGCGKTEDYLERFLPHTDLFYWDIKLMDDILYHQHTGGQLQQTLHNLELLSQRGAHIVLRLLFIPDIHLQPNVLEATKSLCYKYQTLEKEIIPYHLFGNAKREALGLNKIQFREPTLEETDRFKSVVCEINGQKYQYI